MAEDVGTVFGNRCFAYYIHAYTDLGTTMIIPFTHKVVDLGWVYFPLMFFVMLGTANGANFTDGLDGLASSVTVLIATFFAIASIAAGSGVTPITCAVVGSLLGFWYTMSIQHVCSWEIPDHWHWVDLLRRQRICCRCH